MIIIDGQVHYITINGQVYYTTNEVSEVWEVKPATIKEYCKKGLIPGFFCERKRYYIPSGAIKPDIRAIKAALSLCLLQSNRDISENRVQEILSNPLLSKRIEYLIEIEFIAPDNELGPGRFSLTQKGRNFLSNTKINTIMSILKRHVGGIEFSVEVLGNAPILPALTIRTGINIYFRDTAENEPDS